MRAAWMWIGILLAALCLPMAARSAEMQDASAPAAAAPQASPLVSTRLLSFKQLGANSSLKMRGGNAVAVVNFGSRVDELITSITLHLRYIYSPAMLTELSHIQVLLNNQVVTVLPFTKGQGGKVLETTLTLDPRLLSSFNQIQFRLIGHYTERCEDEAHSSIWAEVSNSSEMTLTVQALPFANDLTFFPEPFFDQYDYTALNLPMMFSAKPSMGTLRAAGELASWFGALSGWRGSRFPVILDGAPPPQHGIVFATNAERPSFLASLPPVQGPMIAIMSHPMRPEKKLLLLLGRDAKDLALAIRALEVGQAGMTGDLVNVHDVKLIAPRKPYDAPNWVRSDAPTRLGDLVARRDDLQVSGLQLSPMRVPFRVPGDLFTWGSRGIPLNLKFRYTGPQTINGSRLTIGINDFFVQSLNLNASGIGGVQTNLRLPVLENGLLTDIDQILLPPFRVSSRNELQFQFAFAYEKQGECANGVVDSFRAEVDPDSTIDFSQYPHYAQMPNLALFATSGFPFTKLADLAETAVVLPAKPQRQDIDVFLAAMGRMGASTGFPALRYRLVNEDELDPVKGTDLLVIGNSRRLTLLRDWRARLPTMLDGDNRQVADGANSPQEGAITFQSIGIRDNPVNGEAAFTSSGKVAALIGMESPLTQGRSVVIITASGDDAMGIASSALSDDGKLGQMSGSVVLIRGDNVDSQALGPVYHVGSLPLWAWIWLFLSGHPLLLAGLSAVAVLIAALVILRIFRMLAARRLRES
ncbi:cellulose biosynthesis cyclic di-GMP-binding regulatory protein BcsB [Chromobacterium sp. IIBBL 290-4]|uniref:cellulose biosynthesis cyclic di-GMP-binding regulatory protein BcsB n=1 Tax=Chromobacterium sp. IIBBL 290-4 TaxID=2953890 RepID=UPI0020B80D16|nr:cellulose biosynthesis cyclic di-GMP-binding regulatory protein BcsB [Chromobacterium sp. IIBBL 290-4]UTH73441.1 cellulose biosynthesis cyclic di-GMP-binding regulatory protein BcsB [Chromobacterium sp. IIBBL 290-4]